MATPRSTRHRHVFRLAILTGIVTSLFGSLLAVPTAACSTHLRVIGTGWVARPAAALECLRRGP